MDKYEDQDYEPDAAEIARRNAVRAAAGNPPISVPLLVVDVSPDAIRRQAAQRFGVQVERVSVQRAGSDFEWVAAIMPEPETINLTVTLRAQD